jgi:hypothetical protein
MVRFSDLHEVQAELDALAARSEALVVRLPRAPGQKEERYAQLLGGAVRTVGYSETARPEQESEVPRPEQEAEAGLPRQVEAFRDEVAELRAELRALRRDLDDLRAQLGA